MTTFQKYHLKTTLILVGLCVISFGASAKLQVVTSFTVIADMAKQVAGDYADVHSITKPGAEIHDYSPTPKDIVKALRADVILWNGLNLERWYKRFLQDIRHVPSFIISEGIEPLSIYSGPYQDKPNPHAWMSLSNAAIYIDNISEILQAMDAKNAKNYQRNAKYFKQKIKRLQRNMEKRMLSIEKQRRYLVTSEGAFSYLARDFNFKELFLWPINADQQGTPKQVRRVIDEIRRYSIPVIFSESTISDKAAKQVAKETDAIYGGVLYVDSLSKAGGVVPTYLRLLEVTIETIARGFENSSALKHSFNN